MKQAVLASSVMWQEIHHQSYRGQKLATTAKSIPQENPCEYKMLKNQTLEPTDARL